MKALPSQIELLALLDYNPLTGKLLWRPRPRSMFTDQRSFKTWNARYAGFPAFKAVDRKGYKVGAIHNVSYRASRVIYKMVHGIDADQVDHEDGNRKNNRALNLRDVTGRQNQMNMKTSIRNTSGQIGVTWDKSKNKWQAKINVQRKTIHLGRFSDFDEAVSARRQAEKVYGYHQNHGR